MSSLLTQLKCPKCNSGRYLWSLDSDYVKANFRCTDCGTVFAYYAINEIVQRVAKDKYAHGYDDARKEWIHVDDLLPDRDPEEYYFSYQYSVEVLLWDGKKVRQGYAQYWAEDEDHPIEWVESGRDGYKIDGITHWTFLPDAPVDVGPPHSNLPNGKKRFAIPVSYLDYVVADIYGYQSTLFVYKNQNYITPNDSHVSGYSLNVRQYRSTHWTACFVEVPDDVVRKMVSMYLKRDDIEGIRIDRDSIFVVCTGEKK